MAAGSSGNEREFGFVDSIYQQPVRFDVALAMLFVGSAKRVISQGFRKNFFSCEHL